MFLYLLLGTAGFLSLIGMGILSFLMLAVTWRVARSEARKHTGTRSKYAGKVAGLAFKAGTAHIIVTFLLSVSAVLTLKAGQGLLETFLSRWLLDYAGELVIGVWVSYSAITGHLKMGDEMDELKRNEGLADRVSNENARSHPGHRII